MKISKILHTHIHTQLWNGYLVIKGQHLPGLNLNILILFLYFQVRKHTNSISIHEVNNA